MLALGCINAQALDVDVMSYNIRYGTAGDGANDWNSRRELLVEQLRRHNADTIGLQEALRFQIDEIRDALPQYGEIGIGREGGEKGEYSCILYNRQKLDVLDSGTFWLSETPGKKSQDWGAACIRICTWALLADKKTGESFYHYNAHLDHRSAEARLKSVRLIAHRIADGIPIVPFVLTGDFNASEKSSPLNYLKGNGDDSKGGQTPVAMVDTFRVLHPHDTEVGTFNRFKGDKSGAKIDYIMVVPETEVLEAGIDFSMSDGRCISDHFPVTATLRLKKKTG